MWWVLQEGFRNSASLKVEGKSLYSTPLLGGLAPASKTVRVASLQNEVGANTVFSRHKVSHEKCSEIFPEIFEPLSLRLLNALNGEDRGLKVRFSLATIAFDRESAQMSQMLSSQGKNAPSNPYPHYLVRLATSKICVSEKIPQNSRQISRKFPFPKNKKIIGELLQERRESKL